MTPQVTIKPRCNDQWQPLFTDVLITYRGRHYCTRLNCFIQDSPHQRAAQAQLFLQRQARREAEDDYAAKQAVVGQIMSEPDPRPSLIAFAKAGAPPARPALSIVKD
jgi:hypothetical protein